MSDCGHTPLFSEDHARGGVERMPCYFCELAEVRAERDALIVRRDELLKAMVRVTRETPYPEEAGNAGVLLAEVGTLKARVAELEAERARARAAAQVYVERVEALGLAADDNDPNVMATAEPIGAAQADLYAVLGLFERSESGAITVKPPAESVEQLRAERDAARMLAEIRGRDRDRLAALLNKPEKRAACEEPGDPGKNIEPCGWTGPMSELVRRPNENGVTYCPDCGSTAIREDIEA